MSASTATGELTPRSAVSIALLHAKFAFLESIRIPIAVIGNLLFPALALLFFVVPTVGDDAVAATAAVGQLSVFAVMSANLFTYGAGVAEDRALPFDPFVRTLPAAAGPRLAGRVLNGLIFTASALVPIVLLGWLLTPAAPSLVQFLAGLLFAIVLAIPFTLLGLAIGYALSAKAAIAVVQVVLFPMAFAGGLFLPPFLFPSWLNAISLALPSRAARDIMVQITTGETAPVSSWPVLLGWTALFAVLAIVAYRRDEGRRFR